jgi:hypothetical protein
MTTHDVESVPMFQRKSTGDSVLDGNDIDLGDISYGRPDNYNDNDNIPTDTKVSKFTFHQRLTHYMDGVKISQQNRKAVELIILVKAGTTVRNMDPMKKSSREEVLLRKYMQIINEIEDIHFEDESVRAGMLAGYKGAKKSLTGATLLRKLELEMKDIRKFATKLPGFNNPTELPSKTTQLSHI